MIPNTLTMGANAASETAHGPQSARQRILDTAYRLFSRYGVQTVAVNRIIDESGVSTETLYSHFPAKVDLVLAFLDAHRESWTFDWLLTEIHERAPAPRERPLALFDALDEWFQREDFESEVFTRTLLEIADKTDPAHQMAALQLGMIRAILQHLAEQAGVADPRAVGYQLQILMVGSIVCATRGDLDAARTAREGARVLLESTV
jgi:AcrR family transcriptional regulator